MTKKWKSDTVGLVSIGLTLLAFVNKEDRLLTGIIVTAAIIFYIINSFSDDIDEHEEKIRKLEEKLNINDQLVGLKGDIEYLKKEVSRKK